MIQQEPRIQDQTALCPREKGLFVRGCDFPAPLVSREPLFLLLFPSYFSFFSPPFSLRDLYCYISFSFIHPPPTFVSHPCPYLSARPIGYSFWRSVSCCGPQRTVQGLHPHQWGQGVSCGYLIQKGQLLLGLLFYHAPMVDPLGSESPLGSSRGLPLTMWRLPFYDFGLPRTRSFSAVYPGSLDSLHSSSGISSSLA